MTSAGLLFAVVSGLRAQGTGDPRITFSHIGLNEGLPHAYVERFLKDDRGSLWVGMSQGLAVYDGTSFTSVNLRGSNEPIGMRGFAKDHEGIIWVAAEQGPIRVDPVSRIAELLPFPDSLHYGVQTLWFHSVAEIKPGVMLFGTHKGTYFYDTRTKVFSTLRNKAGVPVTTFWRFMQPDSARQGVWITTHKQGLTFYHTPTGKLFEKDGDRSISPLIGEPVVSLCPDGDGGFWCSHRSTGNLVHWDGRADTVRTWDHVPGAQDTTLSRTWNLSRDSKGRIWGSAWNPGGFMFDPARGTAVIFPREDPSPGSLPQASVNDLYEGENGEIWLATAAGIAIYDPTWPQARFFDLLGAERGKRSRRVWTMEFSGDSVLWCAMRDEGLWRIELGKGRVDQVRLNSSATAPPFVWDVLPCNEELMVACDDEVYMLDLRTRRSRRLDVRDQHGKLLEHGYRWLSDRFTGGAWMGLNAWDAVRIDPVTGRCELHVPDSTDPAAIRKDNLYNAIELSNGRTWGVGNIRGLTCYDPRTGHWTDLYNDVLERRVAVGRYTGMTASSDSVLWLASDGAGLVRYDIPTAKYTQYDQRHGIGELGLLWVRVDPMGRVWTNSDERLYCFDPVKERAVEVRARSLTSANEPKWFMSMSPGGIIALGMGNEIAVFDATAVGGAHMLPPPVLTRILVDGDAVDLDADGGLSMRYDHAQLEVQFGAIVPPGSIAAFGMRAAGEEWSEYQEGRVNLRGLQPGTHTFEFRLKNQEGAWGPSTTLRVKIPPPWWQTLVARIAFALLLALSIVLVFRARLNWVRKRERAQEEQARQMNELKLQALRAQMDPHFIFNCLNSIDGFIIGNDREQASHYLGRFAKLIRLILQHSDSTRVPVDREVEMLKYYLELEALRFKTPFSFKVEVDEELEGEPVTLPTMLVQPYIENAIWHGLRHKEGAGRLSVRFGLHDDHLECVVEDDGIGREASRAINRERTTTHRSMGMRVSADRLRLYGELEQGASRVVIADLKNEDGMAAGTRVTISIPLLGQEAGS